MVGQHRCRNYTKIIPKMATVIDLALFLKLQLQIFILKEKNIFNAVP